MPLYSAWSCASTSHKFLKINIRLFLGVIHFQHLVEEKPSDNVQFQQLLKNSGYTGVTVLKTVTKRDGSATIR